MSTARNRRSLVSGVRAITLTCTVLLLGLPSSARAENLVRISTVEADPGDTGVHVLITGRNDEPIHSYSLAVTFPVEALTLSEFDVTGTPIDSLRPAFVAPRIDNQLGFGTFGLVFELEGATGEKFLEPRSVTDSERILARLTFNVKPGAATRSYPIRLTQGVGTASIINEFSSAGNSIEPVLVDGAILVGGENVLLATRVRADCVNDPGAASPIPAVAIRSRNPLALDGVSIVVEYDCQSVREFDEEEDVRLGFDIIQDVGREITDGQIEFYASQVVTIGNGLCRTITGIQFDSVEPFQGQQLLPSTGTVDNELLRLSFTPNYNPVRLPCATTEKIDLRLVQDPIPILAPANNSFAVGARSIEPRIYHGSIYFCTGSLKGRVVDGQTGAALEGATIEIEPDFREATSSVAGTFSFLDFPPGEYLLRVKKSGYYAGLVPEFELTCGTVHDNDVGDITIYPTTPIVGDGPAFRTFDTNQDGRHDLADVFPVVGYFFQGRLEPAVLCLDAIDANGDSRLDLSDAIHFLSYLFKGGPRPVDPFEECGRRETLVQGCERYAPCE